MRLQQAQWRPSAPRLHLPVFRAEDFRATDGVNEGDPLTDASELACGDVYALKDPAIPIRLGVTPSRATGRFSISRDSDAGRPGARVFLDSLLTFMDTAGTARDVLVLVEVDTDDNIAEIYLHPLTQLPRNLGHTLVTIDRHGAASLLATSASIGFARGTRITLADGGQRPVEELRPGDRVMTRGSGPQVLRWAGCDTVRAVGPFAPITIRAGALDNTGDLVVSPEHRLFVETGAGGMDRGQKEVPVRAGNLVNGTTVTRDEGGFIDYVQLQFDKLEIIYIEGIAAESGLTDATPRATRRDDEAHRMGGVIPLSQQTALQIRKPQFQLQAHAAEVASRLSAL